jgi:hypothetical protein
MNPLPSLAHIPLFAVKAHDVVFWLGDRGGESAQNAAS